MVWSGFECAIEKARDAALGTRRRELTLHRGALLFSRTAGSARHRAMPASPSRRPLCLLVPMCVQARGKHDVFNAASAGCAAGSWRCRSARSAVGSCLASSRVAAPSLASRLSGAARRRDLSHVPASQVSAGTAAPRTRAAQGEGEARGASEPSERPVGACRLGPWPRASARRAAAPRRRSPPAAPRAPRMTAA